MRFLVYNVLILALSQNTRLSLAIVVMQVHCQ